MPVYFDETKPNLLWWDLEETDWDLFHNHLSEISHIIEDRETPFVVIFRPSGDMPKGSPIVHLKRMIRVCSHEKVIRLIIVAPQAMRFAWAFVSATSKILGLDQYSDIVTNEEEAIEHYQELTKSV